MSLVAILKTVGKDLSHFGSWLEDGVKIAETILDVVDPPLGNLVTIADNALQDIINAGGKLTSGNVQAVVSAIALLESAKAHAAAAGTQTQGAPATTTTTTTVVSSP